MSPLQLAVAVVATLGMMSRLHADPDVRNSLTPAEISAATATADGAARAKPATTVGKAPVANGDSRAAPRHADAPPSGGALYSPFAGSSLPPPGSPAEAEAIESNRPAPQPPGPGFGLTVAAAAGAAAALIWLVRRF